MQAQIPVYQSNAEPPPLTQAEYEQSLQTYAVAVHAQTTMGYGGTMEAPLEFNLTPKIFADHFMDGYRDLIRSYRDGQSRMDSPKLGVIK